MTLKASAVLLLLVLGFAAPASAEAPSDTARTAPAPESTADWRQVSSGGNHACGIRTSGRLYCWGADGNGQLGDGGAVNADQPAPVEVAGGATNWAAVSAGFEHTCARRTTGRLYCWGADGGGKLGDGGAVNTERNVPVQVAGGATNWTSVSAGFNQSCGRRSTGRLYCWGADNGGQLGDGGAVNTERHAPVQVAGGATNWTSVSAGGDHTCARRSTGRLYCWGSDSSGQLGDGSAGTTERHAPALVARGFTDWTAVSAGGTQTCGRRATGRLYCWGADHNGQLGNDIPHVAQEAPVLVAGGFTDWTSVTAGGSGACARRSTGRLYCWGYDFYGQLGDGGVNTSQPTPVEVAGLATNWAATSDGSGHACARKSNARIYCWGHDANGQLGDGGTNTDQPEPVQVA